MITDSLTTSDNTPFVESEVVEYRSVSPWAVLALLLAVVSPLMLVSPLLIVVPLTSCFLAVVAVLKIRSSAGTRFGVALARWAVALAIICMVAASVRTALRDHLLLKQADRAAQQWLTLLAQNRVEEAIHLLDLDAVRVLMGDPPPGEQRDPPSPEVMIALLRSADFMKALVTKRNDSGLKISLVASAADAGSGYWHARIDYDVSSDSKGSSSEKPLSVSIDMKKWNHLRGEVMPWLVASWLADLSESGEESP